MLGKFNLYDFIAAVIPGLLFLWAANLFFQHFGLTINIPFSGGIADTSVLIALSYVVGLLLQGVSQGITEKILLRVWDGFPSARWLLPDDDHFSKDYKTKVKQIVEKKFEIRIESKLSREEQIKKNQEVFYLCYNAVDKEKLSDRPQIFNAHYGLFRCLLTTFSILLLLDIPMLIFVKNQENAIFYSILIFSFIGAIVSYFRTKKRGEDFVKSIYDLFLTHFSE